MWVMKKAIALVDDRRRKKQPLYWFEGGTEETFNGVVGNLWLGNGCVMGCPSLRVKAADLSIADLEMSARAILGRGGDEARPIDILGYDCHVCGMPHLPVQRQDALSAKCSHQAAHGLKCIHFASNRQIGAFTTYPSRS